jgi:hypothetical protein
MSSELVIPPVAASIAIIPAFRDMVIKSAQQKGESIPSIRLLDGVKGGVKAAPTVGAIVGTQMVAQHLIEKALTKNGGIENMLVSSALVGTASAPILAVFNGQTMGWSLLESLRKFTLKQAAAISIQETAFVAGICATDKLAEEMKRTCGDKKVVEYVAAFLSGAAGSLAGHPANTALTRWQSGMSLDHASQLMWGAARKARAVGCFSVVYKFGKEALSSIHSPFR